MTTMPQAAPCGTWRSPLTAAAVAAGGLRLGAVACDGDDVYWLEGRPGDGGRNVLVKRAVDGAIVDVTPPQIDVQTRVHEYGGGAFVVADGVVYCANDADQRIYRIETAGAVGGSIRKVTPGVDPEPLTPPGAWRYADFDLDRRRGRLVAVREDHTRSGEPVNALVAVPLRGPHSEGTVLVSGADFYSTPRSSPDGSTLAWLSWSHPLMPWQGTELWIARVEPSGALAEPVRVAGGPTESIYQPGWSPGGELYYASDRTGWWQIYRATSATNANGSRMLSDPIVRAAWLREAEFGRPQWVFGTRTWASIGPSRLVVSYARSGVWCLATVDLDSGALRNIATDLQPRDWLAATGTQVVFVAASATRPSAVVRYDLRSGRTDTIREASSTALDIGAFSVAEAIEVPVASGQTTHAFYYPPHNTAFVVPSGERPPLIAISHGGPTDAAQSTLDLRVQYFTSRGFAVADVNYGGSSGFGRAYRERLDDQWGIVDVDDVVCVVRFLVEQGKADGDRLVIRGGSAGGYTTLAALTHRPGVFKAGASYYGVCDLDALERDTHKFESRYLSSLIGPRPEANARYRERSPIHALDQLACPLILFQGLDDPVVPPSQSQMLADAVRAKGLPVAYLAFEGEQHGFRRAESIIRSLEAELFFYGAVFGFTPAGDIPSVPIDNL